MVPNSSSEGVINRPKYLAYFGLFFISSSSKLDGLLEIISLVHDKPIDRAGGRILKESIESIDDEKAPFQCVHCPYFGPGI